MEQRYKIAEGLDIQCDILPVPFSKLANMEPGEPSAAIRERVIRTRAVQEALRRPSSIHCNAPCRI